MCSQDSADVSTRLPEREGGLENQKIIGNHSILIQLVANRGERLLQIRMRELVAKRGERLLPIGMQE